jgi:nicotinate-nucleotide adenylyltransferase
MTVLSETTGALPTVALFGGSFDPIHRGHINSALELCQRLSLDELRFLPCHRPVHKPGLQVSAQQRLAMVALAIEHCGDSGAALRVDDRELRREGLSYTVETLQQLRGELGPEVSLIWVMGTDSFASLDRWHRWSELLSFAHIVVVTRPDVLLPTSGPVAQLIATAQAGQRQQLTQSAAGLIWFEQLTPYAISATAIRSARAAAYAANEPVAETVLVASQALTEQLPGPVIDYIAGHGLYR